ncbi:MAG: protein kinase [Acidimicrobiales bacterium]
MHTDDAEPVGQATVAKIGDFGEAVRMDEQGTAEPLLQPQYWTAPETFNGSRYAVTAEIFSVGMSFREVLSGSYPYDDYTREELAKRLSKNQQALRDRHLECAVHVPTSLRLIAQRASHRSVNRRYQTADAMLEALLSARFVDWQWPVEDDDAQMSWTGAWHGEQLRVSVRSVRGRGWWAQGLRHCPSGWRRLSGCPDADAQTPLEAASKVFSHVKTTRQNLSGLSESGSLVGIERFNDHAPAVLPDRVDFPAGVHPAPRRPHESVLGKVVHPGFNESISPDQTDRPSAPQHCGIDGRLRLCKPLARGGQRPHAGGQTGGLRLGDDHPDQSLHRKPTLATTHHI